VPGDEEIHDIVLGIWRSHGEPDPIKYGISIARAVRDLCAPQNTGGGESRAIELLQVILPMAKGYAYKNQVGSNNIIINEVENFLATRPQDTEEGK